MNTTHKQTVRQVSNDREVIPYEKAVALLPDGERIHTFVNPGMDILVGADWDRADILKAFKDFRVEIAGPQASAMDHGLCFRDGRKWVFVQTRKEAP